MTFPVVYIATQIGDFVALLTLTGILAELLMIATSFTESYYKSITALPLVGQ